MLNNFKSALWLQIYGTLIIGGGGGGRVHPSNDSVNIILSVARVNVLEVRILLARLRSSVLSQVNDSLLLKNQVICYDLSALHFHVKTRILKYGRELPIAITSVINYRFNSCCIYYTFISWWQSLSLRTFPSVTGQQQAIQKTQINRK